MKHISIGIFLLLFILFGCQEHWDDHYGDEEDERSAGATMNMWETLSKDTVKFTKFAQLLKETGLDANLNRNQILTVWAPEDEYMTGEIMSMDSVQKRRFVLNHLNNLALYKTKLISKYEIETLAGKYLELGRRGKNLTIDNVTITEVDMACTNGVIHSIAGVLKPIRNIYEYMMDQGEDYSLFRDSLFAYNDTLFLPEESFALGVDSVGQTIYDSVFLITNTLLRSIDFMEEMGSYTLLLPSNEVIAGMYQDVADYFQTVGREFTKEDSVICFNWMLRAAYFNGKITNFGSGSYYSVNGKELRFNSTTGNAQVISTNFEECSNGVVYDFQKVYIPHTEFMKGGTFNFLDVFSVPEEERSQYYQLSSGGTLVDEFVSANPDGNKFVDHSREFLHVPGDGGKGWVELLTLTKDKYANVTEGKLMPGKYKLRGQWYGYTCCDTKIWINGDPLIYSRTKGDVFTTNGNTYFEYSGLRDMCDTVVIKEQYGYRPLTIKIQSNGGDKPIRVQRFVFEPVGNDNY